jgi:hypothetical protein
MTLPHRQQTPPLPIVLHVCRESRDEALSRYKIIFRRASGIRPVGDWKFVEPRPICLDPKHDRVYIRHASLSYLRAAGFHCWLNYLKYHYSDCMRSLKTLHLRDFIWNEIAQSNLHFNKNKRQITEMYLGPLLRLGSLEKLYLEVLFPEDDDVEDSIKEVQEFLDLHEERFDRGKAPRVLLSTRTAPP